MLDFDHKVPLSKAVWGGCADTHDRWRWLLSIESLAQTGYERRCLGFTGRSYICPHLIVDYDLVTAAAHLRSDHGLREEGRFWFIHLFLESSRNTFGGR